MNETLINIATITIGTLLGLSAGLLVFKNKKFIDVEKIKKENEELLSKSKTEAENFLATTKTRTEERKKALEEETLRKTEWIKKTETSLKNKEENVTKKEQRNKETKLKIASVEEEAQSAQGAIKRTETDIQKKLSSMAKTSAEDIKKELLYRNEEELTEENKKKIIAVEDYYKENGKKLGAIILTSVIQRLGTPTSVESKTGFIKVPKDYIKGKIVGKDGKNIEEIEKELDAAIIFNDLPQTISISSYDLIAKAVAQKTIEKLITKKGEIGSETIKQAIKEARKETEEQLYEIGEKALAKMGIKSTNKEFLRVIGRLQYRTSYGQNIMRHSMEVGWLATMLGGELGLDIEVCKTAGFLHDLGKAIDQDPDIKDAHDHLTKELMTKFDFSEKEIHAAWAHHDAVKQETAEALIVKAADAISGGRPGARQDSIERYVERMQAIDDTVASFKGVAKSFIMSAGREVRVMVNPEEINDENVKTMAINIARKLEENVTYPGKIKVKVIRRTKSLEIAK